MKKVIGLILTIILMASIFVGCSVTTPPDTTTNNDDEKVKGYIVSYANAVIKAWDYGFSNDCIFENENESTGNIDLDQLAAVTGFEKSAIENVLRQESSYGVNINKNKFYALHQEGILEVEIYEFLQSRPQLSKDEYLTIVYNLEMVKYLFEKIGKDECDEILAKNSLSNEMQQKLTALYEYTKNIHTTCLNDTQYKFLFPDNFDIISQEIQGLCADIA